MFYQDNKSICASFPVFSILWVESEATMRSFLQFHNQSSGTLWLSLIGRSFSPPQLYFVVWSSERNLSSPSYYPGLASFPFTLWIHLTAYQVMISGSHRWCGDDISLGKGKGWNVSTFPPTSFHLSPSLPFHLHLPVPPLPIFHSHLSSSSWKTHQFIQWRFLQDQVKATQLIAIDFLFGQRTSCQSGKLVARGRENDWEGDMWMVLFIWVRTRHLNHSHDNYFTTFSPNIYLGSNTEQVSWFQIQFHPRKGLDHGGQCQVHLADPIPRPHNKVLPVVSPAGQCNYNAISSGQGFLELLGKFSQSHVKMN